MSKAIKLWGALAYEGPVPAKAEAEKSNAMAIDIKTFTTDVKAYQVEHTEK